MITLARMDGQLCLVNPDLIERADSTPDTVLLFTNGTKLMVRTSLDEIAERIVAYRAAILVEAERQGLGSFARTAPAHSSPHHTVAPIGGEESGAEGT